MNGLYRLKSLMCLPAIQPLGESRTDQESHPSGQRIESTAGNEQSAERSSEEADDHSEAVLVQPADRTLDRESDEPYEINEVESRGFFVETQHRCSDSSVEPNKLGDVHGQRMKRKTGRFNEFVQAVFGSGERKSSGHNADRLICEPAKEREGD